MTLERQSGGQRPARSSCTTPTSPGTGAVSLAADAEDAEPGERPGPGPCPSMGGPGDHMAPGRRVRCGGRRWGAAERRLRPSTPSAPQRTTVGSHSSPVRPPTGQHATASDDASTATASTTPKGWDGRAARPPRPRDPRPPTRSDRPAIRRSDPAARADRTGTWVAQRSSGSVAGREGRPDATGAPVRGRRARGHVDAGGRRGGRPRGHRHRCRPTTVAARVGAGGGRAGPPGSGEPAGRRAIPAPHRHGSLARTVALAEGASPGGAGRQGAGRRDRGGSGAARRPGPGGRARQRRRRAAWSRANDAAERPPATVARCTR